MESTEMPAHSNKVRMDFGVPVFDISTVGRCVMSAADTFRPIGVNDLFLALFRNPAFRDCITRLFDASFIEPKFGTQADGTLRFYEGLPQVRRRPAPSSWSLACCSIPTPLTHALASSPGCR